MTEGSSAPQRSETLPRALILRRRAQMAEIRSAGRRFSNREMTLFFQPKKSEREKIESAARVAFLTPKKIGTATVRNRLRRRMREIYRRYLSSAASSASKQIWVARSSAAAISFEDLKQAMMQLALRAN